MAKVKTWIWVVVGVIALGILGIVAMAAAGLWFVRSHVEVKQTTSAAAASDFESVLGRFSAQKPLIELDDRGDFVHANTDRPAGTARPEAVMVFDPEEEKVIRMELPMWLLRLKPDRTFNMNGNHVDMAKLHLTVEDLDRYGPTLILNHQDQKGAHVVVWTQ
jgi:hypothetical protein